MDDTDRESFLQYAGEVGLSLVGDLLRFTDELDADETEHATTEPTSSIHFSESRQYKNLLTSGGISLPKTGSRDKSDSMKRTKAAYRKLVKWLERHFTGHLEEVFQNGDRNDANRHWLRPGARTSVESRTIELCHGTNSSSRFILVKVT